MINNILLVILFGRWAVSATVTVQIPSNSKSSKTPYLSFDPNKERVDLKLTQLQSSDNVDFNVMIEFFEEDARSTLLGSVEFKWNTEPGRTSLVSLYENLESSSCYVTNPNLLQIPDTISIDIESDEIIKIDKKYTGDFQDDCENAKTWNNWKSIVSKVKTVQIALSDDNYKKTTLSDYFSVGYNILEGCEAGEYLSSVSPRLCAPCPADHYSEGRFRESCDQCQGGKFVRVGEGKSAADCKWGSCSSGQYVSESVGCVDCQAGSYSGGGSVDQCDTCPSGSYSDARSHTCLDCSAGSYSSSGAHTCTKCSAGTYSAARAEKCLKCADGSVSVEEGAAKCEMCRPGTYSDSSSTLCVVCEEGYYSDWGAVECSQCPDETSVREGKGTSKGACKTQRQFSMISDNNSSSLRVLIDQKLLITVFAAILMPY